MTYLKRDAREEQLIALTVQLLTEKGYRATTTRDIAALGGVAVGNITRLFGSLTALKHAALYRINDRLVADTEAASVGKAPLDGLMTLLGDPTDARNQHVMSLWREVAVLANSDPTLLVIHQHALRGWAQSVAGYLEAQAPHVRLRDSASRTAWRLIGFATGMDLLHEIGAMPGSLDEMKQDLARFIAAEIYNDEVR